jgi:hypothetical protein
MCRCTCCCVLTVTLHAGAGTVWTSSIRLHYVMSEMDGARNHRGEARATEAAGAPLVEWLGASGLERAAWSERL